MNRPSASLDHLTMGTGSGVAFGGGDRLQELAALINQVATKRVQSQRSVEAVLKARERANLEKKLSSSTKWVLTTYYCIILIIILIGIYIYIDECVKNKLILFLRNKKANTFINLNFSFLLRFLEYLIMMQIKAEELLSKCHWWLWSGRGLPSQEFVTYSGHSNGIMGENEHPKSRSTSGSSSAGCTNATFANVGNAIASLGANGKWKASTIMWSNSRWTKLRGESWRHGGRPR